MTKSDGSWRGGGLRDGKRKQKNMRMWRNWQTRRFQVPVGDHMGSSPFIRTNEIPIEIRTLYGWTSIGIFLLMLYL